VQCNGPTETIIRGACARVEEQAVAVADRPSRAVLRPTTPKEWCGGGQGGGSGGSGEETASS